MAAPASASAPRTATRAPIHRFTLPWTLAGSEQRRSQVTRQCSPPPRISPGGRSPGAAAARRRERPSLPCARAEVLRHHVRLPDERPRLGADQGHARGARARRGADRRRTPTSSSSTPARSVRSPTPSSPRTSGEAAARKRRDPDRVIAVGGCYAEAQRDRIFELYPDVDVAFGPGSIAHLARLARRRRGGGGPRPLRARRPRLRRDAPDAPRAHLPGLGAGVDGLQLDVRLLHRPGRPRARAEPPPRRDRRRGHSPRRRRRQGDHAPRPERQLVGPRPRPGRPHRVRRAPARLRRRRRDRADPLHEPAPEGLPRPRDRRDRRVRRGLRARPPAAPVRLLARPQGDASHVHPRALPRARREAARGDPRPRARHRHHRRLPRRDRRRVRGDARGGRGGRVRQRLHVRLLAPAGHRGGRDGRTGAPRGEDRADGAARRADAANRRRAERRPRRSGRAGARRGPVAHRREPSARPHPAQHDRELHGQPRSPASSSTSGSSMRPRRRSAAPRQAVVPVAAGSGRVRRCGSSSPARPARSARIWRCADCATVTGSSASTSARTPGRETSTRCSRTSPATTRRSRAG